MPSRRAVLAASGTAAATALAGCSALTGPDGSSANVREHRDLRPEDGEVVARATAERVGCPRGDVELRAVGYERPHGDLQVLTEVDVYPGRRGCDSDWRHDGIDASHDWSGVVSETESFVTSTETNVLYADTDDPEVYRKNIGNSETGEWRVRRASADGGIHETYAFRSTYGGAAVESGDDLATVTAAVPFSTGGLLGGDSETVTLSETLTYGDREE